MTIDDESSIYVGGLPYDITEESLRRVFVIYGAVVAVKIINDRSISGKCYGFVTFANPRSAMHAIKEMDGKIIDGRMVKVNDVRTRGGGLSRRREASRHDLGRGIDGDGDGVTNRGKDANYDRSHNRDRHVERSEFHKNDSDRDRDHTHGYDHIQDRHDGGWFREHDRGDVEKEHDKKRGRDWEKNHGRNIGENRDHSHHKVIDKDRDLPIQFLNRSSFGDLENREHSFDSLNCDQPQADEKLMEPNQKIEGLHEEISLLKGWTVDKEEEISKLREECEKLEGSLVAAKELTSFRRMQLSKMCKSYLQVRDNDAKLKKSEEEFQLLLNSTMMELE